MSTELRRPSASYSGPMSGDSDSISAMTVVMALNMPPCVEFTLQDGDDATTKATKPTMASLATVVAAQQDRMFTSGARTEPDTIITISDGAGNTQKMEGFSNGFAYNFAVGAVGGSYRLLQKAQIMSRLQTSIYNVPFVAVAEEDTPDVSTETSWSARLKETLEKMIEIWEADDGSSMSDDGSVELSRAIHAANEEALKAWMEVLDASSDSTNVEALSDFSDPVDPLNGRVSDDMKRGYLMRAEDFLSGQMRYLMASYQLYYIPSWDGYGQLTTITKAFEDIRDVTVSAVQVSIDIGSPTLDVITHVLMQGVGTLNGEATSKGNDQQNAGKSNIPNSTIAVVPDTDFDGASYIEYGLFPWLQDSINLVAKSPEDLKKNFGSDSRTAGLSAAKFMASAGRSVTFTKTINDKVKTLAEEVMLNIYRDVALGSSSISFAVPLDVSTWEPGRFYNISVEDSDGEATPAFTGMLNRVQHTLAVQTQRGTAITSLSFSHVSANGFTLPGT